jgi:hypothetical protein
MHQEITLPDTRRDGLLRCPGLWDAATVAEVAALVRAALASGLDGSGVRVLFPADLDPRLLRHLTTGPLARAVTAALGGPAEFLSVKPVVKDGGHGFATPWHQDRPYWGGCDKWSAWIALGDVDAGNGCLRVVPGSHQRAMAHRSHGGDPVGFVNRIEGDPAGAVDVPLAAGDAIVFHDLLLHASHACAAGRSRVALIPTYRARGMRDESTVWDDPRAVDGGN